MGEPSSIQSHLVKFFECMIGLFPLLFFDVESCPGEMTKCGGKRGRRSKQLKCLTAAQGAISKRPPLLLVAVIIAWLTDRFEGRADDVIM